MKNLTALLIITCLMAQKPTRAQSPGDTIAFKKIIDSAVAVNHKSPRKVLDILKSFPYTPSETYPFHLEKRYLYAIGESHLQLRNMAEADSTFNKLVAKALEKKDSGYVARSYNGLSFLHSINENGKKSIYYANKALQYVDSTDSQYASYLANMAHAYGANGQYYKKLQIFDAISHQLKAQGNSANLSTIYNNIGLMYSNIFDDDSAALNMFRQALTINKAIDSKFGIARNYANIGMVFNSLKNYDSAYYYLKESLNLKEQSGFEGNNAINYFNLGENQYYLNNWDRSLYYYKKCLRSSNKAGIPLGVYYGSMGHVKVFIKTGQLDSAGYYLQQAQSFAEESDNLEILLSYHDTRADYYEQTGDFKQALQDKKLYQSYRDSIDKQLQNRKLLALQTEYETKLTKAENRMLRNKQKASQQKLHFNQAITVGLLAITIILLTFSFIASRLSRQRKQLLKQRLHQQKELKKQNQKLKVQESNLFQLNELKDRILFVLGHDLRAPLASISGALEVIQDENLPKSDFNLIIEHLRRDTEGTLGTLENILNWARLQDGSETLFRNEESAQKLIQDTLLAVHTLAESKNITLNPKVPKNMKIWVDKNQFSSILRNLTTNAIKFTPSGGTVHITFIKGTKQDCFTVRDEGSGMPEGLMDLLNNNKRIKSTTGTNGEKGTGIGLQLVRDFVKAHGGELNIQSTSKGTCAKVCLPTQASILKKTPGS